jgi:L-lactate dehydrogenase complex protein LldG
MVLINRNIRKNKRNDNLSERSAILQKINKAISARSEIEIIEPEFPFFRSFEGSLSDSFKKMLEDIGGEVIIVKNEQELVEQISALVSENGWKEIVCAEDRIRTILSADCVSFEFSNALSENTEVGITGCEYLIASLGSVLVSNAQSGSRRIFVYPPVHIVIAQSSQLVGNLEEAYQQTIERYKDHMPSMITVITGPSRTADIEKTLIMGAHGPKRLIVFIVSQDN